MPAVHFWNALACIHMITYFGTILFWSTCLRTVHFWADPSGLCYLPWGHHDRPIKTLCIMMLEMLGWEAQARTFVSGVHFLHHYVENLFFKKVIIMIMMMLDICYGHNFSHGDRGSGCMPCDSYFIWSIINRITWNYIYESYPSEYDNDSCIN